MSTHNPDNTQSEKRQFNDPQDEINYLRSKLEETQTEFQEFQESSRDLEAEYETQIKQLEKKNRESLSQIRHQEDELDQLRTRYNTYTSDTQHKLNEYQKRIAELTSLNDRLTSYIRELEQGNDDLERARRALAASLEDFEGQLNQQIERNVLLENEVSEKEELECVIQRLKEEARDLRHELIVSQNSSDLSKRQLVIDNHPTNSQGSPSPQSPTSPKTDLAEKTPKKFGEVSLNGQTHSQILDSPIANGSGHKRLPNVDSTTEPMTPPQTGSRFSFSSPFSYSKSSSSRSSKSQQTSTPSSPTLPSIVMTPSSRISALNIVSDLLKKVGALESKLASAKKLTS